MDAYSSSSASAGRRHAKPDENCPTGKCKKKPGRGKEPPKCSKDPVRYVNGAVQLTETDLGVPNGGLFGHPRAYGNRAEYAYDGPNGYNWFVEQMPYVVADGPHGVAVVFDSNNPYWFDKVGGRFVPRYGVTDVSLVHDSAARTFTFTDATGDRPEVTVFRDFNATAAAGELVSHTDARGIRTVVTSRASGRIAELQRDITAGGSTTTESLAYAYLDSGNAYNRLASVTLRRRVGGGPWATLRRAAYTYYGPADPHGSANDLRTATRQRPDGAGGWQDVAVSYYRYYKPGSPSGFAHGLKLHLGPEACRKLFNANTDLDAATDAALLPHADHYFEYDPATRAATKEVAAVCESCAGGGTTHDRFAYAKNPRNPAVGYNVWAVRTTQTLPDDSKIVVYSNGAGNTMLQIRADAVGDRRWATFYRYDAAGQVIWEAKPSAVNLPTGPLSTVLAALESHDDLLNRNAATGKYQYLRDNDGLVEVTDYYAASNVAGGHAEGYMSADKLRKGQAGADVLLRSYTYTSQPGSDNHPVATTVVYPDEANLSVKITTSYAYTWHPGTNQMQSRTTTLPVVPASQNGSGVADTVVEEFDLFGHLVRRTDERGAVNEYAYDAVTGTMTRQTLNVLTGVTEPGANVVTDFAYDDEGRPARTFGPAHTAVVSGTATTVRTATWTVTVESPRPATGPWGPDEVRSGRGYATGAGPAYAYTLVDPVSVTRSDKDGRTLDQITSKRTTGTGALAATDTFDQSDWQSWSSTQYDDQHRTVSARVYHLVPATGESGVGTHYGQADYGYDALERRNRVRSPGGTITRTIWTAPQRQAATWVGTDDTGATDAIPAGTGGANNMVLIAANEYDGGTGGGNGNLTKVTQYASATDARVTLYGYDWRDRQTTADGEADVYAQTTYDNLGRSTRVDRRDTSAAGNLIGRAETRYDDRGRAYRTLTHEVDPATGTVGNALVGDTWYDAAGNVVQAVAQGDGQAVTKTTYNKAGWPTATYRGYNTAGVSHAQALIVTNDTIFSQTETTYDEAGNVVSTAASERLNDAPATGAGSTGVLRSWADPKARVSYAAAWYDGVDRQIASANYGAIAGFSRPADVPARSDDVLVTETAYDAAGRAWQIVDPRGIEARTAFDAAGRTTQTVEAYDATATATDRNRTTNYTYAPDGQVATLTAVNAHTGDQTTTYAYGSTLAESGVARGDLLRTTTYPDYTVANNDQTATTYNRLGQPATFTDQRGTVHTYAYDKLGRPIHDRATTLGGATDGTVRRISRTYEVRGMLRTAASHDDAAVNSGTVLNEVRRTYNHFGQLTKEEQAVAGAVTGTTPNVHYAYASAAGNSNRARLTTLTYPNGRAVAYDYGTAGAADDRLGRIAAILDGATSLAAYTYLGGGRAVRVDHAQPQLRLDLWGGTSGTFAGLDRFGRVTDQRWVSTATSADVDRLQYTYDRNSNRTVRSWSAAQMPAGGGFDERYTYDPLDRLVEARRGTLDSSRLIPEPAHLESWSLDTLGNWTSYSTAAPPTPGDVNLSGVVNITDVVRARNNEGKSGGMRWIDGDMAGDGSVDSADTDVVRSHLGTSGTPGSTQARTHDATNRIVSISGAAYAPTYDAAGNLTRDESGQQYAYDAWNHTVKVKDASGTDKVTYTVDPLGRRAVETVGAAGAGTTTELYYSAGWQVLEERQNEEQVGQTVYGLTYVDAVVARDNPFNGDRHYVLQDANFNVTAVTDPNGDVSDRYQYTAYGERAVLDADFAADADGVPEAPVPNGFQGLRLDRNSGNHDARHRDYRTSLARWLQTDPAGNTDGVNAYEFVRCNPISASDPLGLQATSPATNPVGVFSGGQQVGGVYVIPPSSGVGGTLTITQGVTLEKGGLKETNGIEVTFQQSDNKSRCPCQWIQFTKRTAKDLAGNDLNGGMPGRIWPTTPIMKNNGLKVPILRNLGMTYNDSLTADAAFGTRVRPNGNISASSFFDTPSNVHIPGIADNQVSEMLLVADLYLECNKKIQFHVHWEKAFGPNNKNGVYRNVSGEPANSLPPNSDFTVGANPNGTPIIVPNPTAPAGTTQPTTRP